MSVIKNRVNWGGIDSNISKCKSITLMIVNNYCSEEFRDVTSRAVQIVFNALTALTTDTVDDGKKAECFFYEFEFFDKH